MARDWLRRLLSFERAPTHRPVEPGLYHMMQETNGNFVRFHLRVDNDGSGMLIANAMATAQLSSSGVVIAKALLEGHDEQETLDLVQRYFAGADTATVRNDITRVQALIDQIKAPGDTYPVFNLEDAAISPYSTELMSPLQASVPLAGPEALLPIFDRLWDIATPHVTLLVPDAFDPSDLLRAVEHAEDLGMITGIRSRASNLRDTAFLARLRQTGVDHITFLYASTDPAIHDALCGAGDHAAATALLSWLEDHQVSAVAEVPLVQATLETLPDTVGVLIENGADNLSFVAYASTDGQLAEDEGVFTSQGMAQVATTVEETANMVQARFIWNPPVERDPRLSLKDQVLFGPRCSGDVAIRVESTGEVIPPRGPYVSAGNLIYDKWDSIWNDPVFRDYRERVEAPTRCDQCPGLTICAADCPRDPKGWARSTQ